VSFSLVTKRFRHLEITEGEQAEAEAVERAEGTPVRTAAGDMARAVESARSGRYETALQLYTRAISQDRALIPAWVGQVQMLVELEELDEARLWSDKALELFRNNGELLAAKSRACARLGDHRAAMACSDASLRSPGSSAARWQVRGEVLLEKNDRRARDCFEKSLAEPDADWFDRVIVARIYLWHACAAAALEFVQLAIGLKPAHAYAWAVLAQCQDALGWLEQAEASLERCLELAPQDREAADALTALRSRTRGQRVIAWLRSRLRGRFRR